ncbi:Protein-lysine N-methyltransferase efm4 [Saitoella coloradoensis]
MSTDDIAATDLPASKLGTQEYWDNIYQREQTAFNDIGDEGEVWFGEESEVKILEWCEDNLPPSPDLKILDLGTGNGHLLFELEEAGYEPSTLFGVDYSPSSIALAKSIAAERGIEGIIFEERDITAELPPSEFGAYDFVVDKGTFDAISLNPTGSLPRALYAERVFSLVKPGGYFLIVSCNWTEKELEEKLGREGFVRDGGIKFKSFEFGGVKGSEYSSIAFRKVEA